MHSYEELAKFWDTYNLADYWEQTETAEFEISPHARRYTGKGHKLTLFTGEIGDYKNPQSLCLW